MTVNSSTISVITVTYNCASTISDCLNSVAVQSYSNIEHIVIDGASTDDTLDIIENFRPRLAKVVSESDEGIYDAMNKGLDQASGDIICFLNSDDYYASPSVLSSVVSQMDKYQLDALIGDVGFFRKTNPKRMVRRYCSGRFTPERLAWGWMPAHPALFLKRTVVERVGHFKTDYSIAGDFEFIVRAFCGHSVRYQYFSRVLVHMQIGGASTRGWKSKVILNQEVLRACRENGLHTNILKIISKYPLKLLEMVHR